MKKLRLIKAVLLFAILASPEVLAKGAWNSDLSKMMDGLEKQVGRQGGPPMPPGPPPATVPKSVPGQQPSLSPVPEMPPTPAPTGSVTPTTSLPPEPQSKATQTQKIDKNKILLELGKLKENYLGSIANHGLTRWNQASMPIKIYIEQTSNAKLFRDDFPPILKKAFQAWVSASGEKIKIEFIDSTNQAQMVCRWTDDKNELMSLKEGGNTVIVPDDQGILSVDMKILTLPPPGASVASNTYMERVALHEAGHALGLTGHSSERLDVMFPTVYANDPANLTERDKNSLIELYKLDEQTIASIKLDQAKALKELPKEFDNPQVNAVRLNNQAARAMKSNKFDIAKEKLEQAHKLDPKNKLVQANLGAVYANYGSVAGMTFNIKLAAQYFKKAIPLLEASNNKFALKQVLTNYSKILIMLNKKEELKIVQAKLAKLN